MKELFSFVYENNKTIKDLREHIVKELTHKHNIICDKKYLLVRENIFDKPGKVKY